MTIFICFFTGIAPITVITHRDKLKTEDDEKDAFDEASAATGSSPSHTFFMWNYTKENKERNPEIEQMTFDILHIALMTAERAVKIMKQKEKNKREDEMMKALEGVTINGQVAPDSVDGELTRMVHVATDIGNEGLCSMSHRFREIYINLKPC